MPRNPRLVVALALLVGAGATAACGSSPSSSSAEDGVWHPSRSDRWHIQYSGDLEVPEGVDVVDLDMEETPEAVISGLQDEGIRVVCYISAGSWEPYRDDADAFPTELLGSPYEGFEDERWFDIRSPDLRPLLTARIAAAEDKGCDAVDPDNVNGYENDTGFALTEADQLEFNRWLFGEVHDHGMAVGLKNGLAQAADLVDEVEFQVNEECIQYADCADLAVFVEAGKPVWSIEYTGDPSTVCATADELGFATWIKDLPLSAGGHECPLP